MTRLRAAASALLGLLILLLAAGLASAQTFPAYTGLVVDNANVLPPAVKASLTTKLEAFQQRTKRQLVVATIADMQGYPLADYGYKLGRIWGVGLHDADNGAILFLAPNNPRGQRGPRIEVGRGLEPVLTDALSRIIIETRMIPRLEANDVPGAMAAGTDAIIEQLSLPDQEAAAKVAAAEAAFDRAHRRTAQTGGGFTPAIGFVLIAFAVVLIALRSGRARGQRYHGGGGSNLPIVLWGLSELGRGSGSGIGSGWGGGSGWGDSGGGGGSWGGGGFTGGGGGDFGGGGASGNW